MMMPLEDLIADAARYRSEAQERIEFQKHQVEQEFHDLCATCGELTLYFTINLLGGHLWRMNHDIAHGRITSITWEVTGQYVVQAKLQLAVEQTWRFGVVAPFQDGAFAASDMYFRWFRYWHDYVEGLPKDVWQQLDKLITAREDVTGWRPDTDWRTRDDMLAQARFAEELNAPPDDKPDRRRRAICSCCQNPLWRNNVEGLWSHTDDKTECPLPLASLPAKEFS